MKLSNFILLNTEGANALDWVFYAQVDVTEGILFWKKTRTEIIRREYCGFWHFVDSGKYVSDDVLALARSWTAKTGQKC